MSHNMLSCYLSKKQILHIENSVARDNIIVKLTSQGFTAKEVSQVIHISDRTVEAHLSRLRVRYNCRNNVQLVCEFIKAGRLSLDEEPAAM